jgi:hypothetical protein
MRISTQYIWNSRSKKVSKTKVAKRARDYRKEYDDYQGTPAQKKRRAARNQARRVAMREGRVHKGDGKELDHVGYHRTGSLRKVPTKVVSRHANRIRQPPDRSKKLV